jgi:UDP-N-acetylglucosamine 2-epimerase (non-hydrolysing)
LRGEGKTGKRPHLWDGKAAERIVAILAKHLA